jgi:hypothetical protein
MGLGKTYTTPILTPGTLVDLSPFVESSARSGLLWIDEVVALPVKAALSPGDLMIAFRDAKAHTVRFESWRSP